MTLFGTARTAAPPAAGAFGSARTANPPSAGQFGAVASAWTPADLFDASQGGGWYDPSDLTSMFQDAAGTTAAAVDSPVGRINDKSGNGNHLTQSTDANRPVLRQSGALFYLEFDGTNDRLTRTLDMSASDELTLCYGTQRGTSAAAAMMQLASGAAGEFVVYDPFSTSGVNHQLYSRGSTNLRGVSQNITVDTPYIMTGKGDIGAPLVSLSKDSGTPATSTDAQGASNYANGTFTLGTTNVGASPWAGDLYQLVIFGGLVSGDDLTLLEAYVAEKSGVTL